MVPTNIGVILFYLASKFVLHSLSSKTFRRVQCTDRDVRITTKKSLSVFQLRLIMAPRDLCNFPSVICTTSCIPPRAVLGVCVVSKQKRLIIVFVQRSPPSARNPSRVNAGERFRHTNGQVRENGPTAYRVCGILPVRRC